jgi:hypothetical protein
MYNYQAGVAQMNAQIAAANADMAMYTGEVNAEKQGMETRYQIGTTKAVQGASGILVGAGSNARVTEGEALVGAQNVGILRSNAAKTAYGFNVQSVQDTAQAGLDTYAAKYSKTAGTLAAAGSLIGGVSSVAGKWTGAVQSGALSGVGGPSGTLGTANPTQIASAASAPDPYAKSFYTGIS